MKRKIVMVGMAIAIMLVLCAMPLACTGIGNKVAVISLSGPIQSGSAGLLFGGSTISPKLVRGQLERAKKDIEVKAVVIQVNSPGGNVAACQEILNELEKLEKPIVVSFGDMAASGGYFISAKADKIVALAASPEQRARLGAGAAELSKRFRWDSIARKTLEVYRESGANG